MEQATVWVDGLARIHRDREILRCHDFSATPMYPSGSGHPAGALFDWIITDFALVDAIESGLVKIPRIPTDDNAGAAVPRYRNLWDHIRTALPRGSQDAPDRGLSLTDYLTRVDGPLKQLGGEWEETFEQWSADGRPVPPAMIVICQDTPLAEVLEKHIAVKGGASAHLQNTTARYGRCASTPGSSSRPKTVTSSAPPTPPSRSAARWQPSARSANQGSKSAVSSQWPC